MKRILFITIFYIISTLVLHAQKEGVQNRPYTDLREFHFGILVGTHLQDMEMTNVGPQTITLDDGTTNEQLISADQDRWDPGFTVGVLGEFRINTYFQLRIAPTMYFGTRHIKFINHSISNSNGVPTEQRQEMKTAYMACSNDLIFAAQRFSNHRPYIMAGVSPMINLNSKNDDFIKLKKLDTYLEFGLGCDFYLQYFKLRPELKFMYSLTNSLAKSHSKDITNTAMLPYTNSINNTHTTIIALTFYFE